MWNEKQILSLFIFIFIYNVFYGGLCFYIGRLNGLLLGLNFITSSCIIGLILRGKINNANTG